MPIPSDNKNFAVPQFIFPDASLTSPS
jgi:3-oxoadipate enol-lactonase